MSVKRICQDAAKRLGITSVPDSFISNNDPTAVQLLALLGEECLTLADEYDWQVLTNEASFTTVATESQGTLASIASDFGRMLSNTMYNQTEDRMIQGAQSPAQWQRETSHSISRVTPLFYIRGNELLFTPTPSAGQTVVFEYISTNFATDLDGNNPASGFAADTDLVLFDDELVTLGLRWRFLESKGFDYAEVYRNYARRLEKRLGTDRAKPQLDLSGGGRVFRPNGYIPDGGWSV